MTTERTSDNFDVNAILALLGGDGGVASGTPEAQPSTADAKPEYIYMTLGEKLQILREMEANSSQYADQAISRGLISDNQRADFQNLISANVRMMEEQRSNINFDPATSPNARLVNSASPNMSSALDQIIVDQYVASNDQTNSTSGNTIAAVNSVEDAFAAEVEEMTDDIRFNPSSNLSEEAAQILNSPLAARLDSGVLMNLRAAVNLQEEKQENGSGAFANGEAWNERREQTERERKEQARVADMMDDAMNNQLSTVPDRFGMSQRDYGELNEELKTRDGQERMMAFLRMIHPEMNDTQIRERMNDMQAVAAVEAGNATSTQRARVDGMSPSTLNDLKMESRQFLDSRGQFLGYDSTRQFGSVAAVNMRSGDTGASVTGSLDRLDAGATSTVVSAAPLTVASVVSGSDQSFASAPSLRANFGQAQAATTPLDGPAAPQIAAVAPAAPPPQVESSGMTF